MRTRTLPLTGLALIATLTLAGCTPTVQSANTPTPTPDTPTGAPIAGPTGIPGTVTTKDGQVHVVDQAVLVKAACDISGTGKITTENLTIFQGYAAYLNMYATGQAEAAATSGVKDEVDADAVFGNLVSLNSGLSGAVYSEAHSAATATVPAALTPQLSAICTAKDAHAK